MKLKSLLSLILVGGALSMAQAFAGQDPVIFSRELSELKPKIQASYLAEYKTDFEHAPEPAKSTKCEEARKSGAALFEQIVKNYPHSRSIVELPPRFEMACDSYLYQSFSVPGLVVIGAKDFSKQSAVDLQFVMAHELGHLALLHLVEVENFIGNNQILVDAKNVLQEHEADAASYCVLKSMGQDEKAIFHMLLSLPRKFQKDYSYAHGFPKERVELMKTLVCPSTR
ncbi:MAG: hypothetical protein H7222_15935 [Methylotenera sp.]|nr:hypothetical protein [Oligoflexia bacterium]